MNFENHISELLYRHQCVVVPGFGAFLTEETSAKIDQNNNVFYAPKKLISFNANLRNNDGLLANKIIIGFFSIRFFGSKTIIGFSTSRCTSVAEKVDNPKEVVK